MELSAKIEERRRIHSKVIRALKEHEIVGHAFDYDKVDAVLESHWDAVEDDEDKNVQAVALELARRARKKNKDERLTLKRPSTPKGLVHERLDPSDAIAFLTLDPQLNPVFAAQVSACRTHFWGVTSPPFDWEVVGLRQADEQAEDWLSGLEVAHAGAKHFTLALECSVDDFGRFDYEVQEVLNALWDAQPSRQPKVADVLNTLARAVAEQDALLHVLPFDQVAKNKAPIPITWKASGEILQMPSGGREFRVPIEGKIRELHDFLYKIELASGWCALPQVLRYVLTGYPPAPARRIATHQQRTLNVHVPGRVGTAVGRSRYDMRELNLAFIGPLPAATYNSLRAQAVSGGKGMKGISRTHVALLQLKAQMPEATWSERLTVWRTWQAEFKELRAFNGTNAIREIRGEWRRALKRTLAWVQATPGYK